MEKRPFMTGVTANEWSLNVLFAHCWYATSLVNSLSSDAPDAYLRFCSESLTEGLVTVVMYRTLGVQGE